MFILKNSKLNLYLKNKLYKLYLNNLNIIYKKIIQQANKNINIEIITYLTKYNK